MDTEVLPYTPERSDAWKELGVFRDAAITLRRWPALKRGARGNGQAALLLPGFRTGDGATRLFRRYLRNRGFVALPWGLGVNGGNVDELLPKVIDQVEQRVAEQGRTIALVGTSLGGYIAREVARDRPDLIHRIVTLGSPVIGGPKYTQAHVTYQRRGFDLESIAAQVEARYEVPLTVPTTAIYSRDDGVVAWPACIDRRSPNVEHVAIRSTHIGLAFNAEALLVTADRLARDEGRPHPSDGSPARNSGS